MAATVDAPGHQWLVQEPDGPAAPKTPGRWQSMWASDCVRLEEAHQRGDAEVLVYGRKYLVDMKERTVRALYWKEKMETRAVIRGTYFVQLANGWLPYPERDSEMLEDLHRLAKGQLTDDSSEALELPLSDGLNKVVMKKLDPSEPVEDRSVDFEIECEQKPVKAPSLISFSKTDFEVHRGTPEPAGWGGVLSTEGDAPGEAQPPKHLVFLVHGIGESLWARASSSESNLRDTCSGIRTICTAFLESERLAAEEKQAGEVKPPQREEEQQQGQAKELDAKEQEEGGLFGGGSGADCGAGYVEFLPVEWFNQVHGDGAVADGLIRDITLESIESFRDFANQAIMDVMYYLTSDIKASILATVANSLNRMWREFSKHNPSFSGKVSIVGHSLGSIIAYDVLIAQPAKGEPRPSEGPGASDIPVLCFEPEVFLACGSPIGTFLSLRSATAANRDKLFKFKTTRKFFNLFHLYDPVAYRLEPLLDRRLRRLQPEHVPHKGGDRIHVTVQKFNRDVNAAIDKVSRTTDAGFNLIQKGLAATVNSFIGRPDPTLNEPETPEDEVVDARVNLPERIDWVLQESALEGMHPWVSAVFAHTSYFQNEDMLIFLLKAMGEAEVSELES